MSLEPCVCAGARSAVPTLAMLWVVMATRTDSSYSMDQQQIADTQLLEAITDALQRMHREEFDEVLLSAASEVTGTDMFEAWHPSFAYLPPEKVGCEYHVAVYATGVCDNCPTDRMDTESIQARLRRLVGSDRVFVDDYFDLFDGGSGPHWVID